MTDGHCCWAGQSWSKDTGRCTGTPRCPAGVASSADDCRLEKTDPISGLTFVFIQGGTFHAGCEPQDTQCDDEEKPGREVTLTGFWLAKTETTVAAYAKCSDAGKCTHPATIPDAACNWGISGREAHPVNCVDARQGKAFCAWIGGRLPSADEWEYAAKGGEKRIYAWGDAPYSGTRANVCDRKCKAAHSQLSAIETEDDGWPATAPVASYAAGATKQGLLDMTGNVGEWTESERDFRVRGGGWDLGTPRYMRSSAFVRLEATERYDTVGFRCAL
jgi:iron(II)-dependent oxidoreductase